MIKLLFLFLLVFTCASLGLAQDEHHKFEVAGSYSIMQAAGIIGDGEVFSDNKDEHLTLNQSLNAPGFGGVSTANLFPTIPFSYAGKRNRPRLNGFNASATYNFSKYVGAKFEMSGNYRSSEVQGESLFTSFPCSYPSGTIGVGGCNAVLIQSSYPPATIKSVIAYPGFASRASQKHYNYLGGLQIKNNSVTARIKPFAHVMAGVSRQTVKFKDFDDRTTKLYGRDKLTNTGFAMEFGGGLDIRLNRRMDMRVVQFDYNPVQIKEQQIIGFKQPITGINLPNNLTFLNTADPGFTQYSPFDIKIKNRWQNNFRIGFGIVFH